MPEKTQKPKKPLRGLNEKAHHEVSVMIHRAVNNALGDMAEYLNYLNDRIEAIETKLNMPALSYAGELAQRYGFEVRSAKVHSQKMVSIDPNDPVGTIVEALRSAGMNDEDTKRALALAEKGHDVTIRFLSEDEDDDSLEVLISWSPIPEEARAQADDSLYGPWREVLARIENKQSHA